MELWPICYEMGYALRSQEETEAVLSFPLPSPFIPPSVSLPPPPSPSSGGS
jgi:hypothetical protein